MFKLLLIQPPREVCLVYLDRSIIRFDRGKQKLPKEEPIVDTALRSRNVLECLQQQHGLFGEEADVWRRGKRETSVESAKERASERAVG